VVVGAGLPPYERADLANVAAADERPSDRDYDRYLWLIEEMRAARYDDDEVVRTASFRVGDVLMTAVLAAASDALADIGDTFGLPAAECDWLRRLAAELANAVAANVDEATGLAADVDERTGEPLVTATLGGFAPLLYGGVDAAAERRLVTTFSGTEWCGHLDLYAPAPPSTSPASADFDPRRYWRGPVWPVMVWLFGWALERRGYGAAAGIQRSAGLAFVADGSFGEYYHPFTGEQLGSVEQSWTAAVTLDWLAQQATA
jgi:hypothetical protein